MSLDTYGDLWRDWLADVAEARKITPEDITALVEALPDRLRAANGDMALLAQQARARRHARAARRGAEAPDRARRRGQGQPLLQAGRLRRPTCRRRAATAPAPRAGARRWRSWWPRARSSTAPSRRARSAATRRRGCCGAPARTTPCARWCCASTAPAAASSRSEVIRRECELVRKAGKPLVVSMGSVAASGGYWISTASDEIWAAPETITGSIGIFGWSSRPSRSRSRSTSASTPTAWAPRASPARCGPTAPLDPAVGDIFQQSIDNGYQDFLARVAEARKMTTEQVDKIAPRPDLERRGREDARARGPARRPAAGDRVGRRRAQAREGLPRLVRREGEELPRAARSRCSRPGRVGASVSRTTRRTQTSPSRRSRSPPACGRSSARSQEVARWNDPRGIYAHCLCGEE